MSIKGTDAQTQRKIIALITYLLKFVETTLPERARLYFSALPTYNPVRAGIATPRNVKTLESQISGYQLFPYCTSLPRRSPCPNPVEWTLAPGVFSFIWVIGLQGQRIGRQYPDLRVFDRRHVPLRGLQGKHMRGDDS